jgi:lyso-ornithine lipid O-acyltransferase
MTAADLIQPLRIPARTAGFVGVTLGMYGLLEVDTALSGAPRREVVLHKWMRRYGRALLKLYGFEVRARGPFVEPGAGDAEHLASWDSGYHPGRDARGVGRLFVMNHRSALDIMVTLSFFEATIVSRADLAGWPVIGMAARRVGTLFVDRSSRRSGAAVVQEMVRALERGRGVMVYPEGTTFAGDEVRPFRAGGFSAACRAGAEIVPVGIAYDGAGSSYMDETFPAHMARVSRARSTLAAIEVGEPIPSLGKDVNVLRDAAHEAVQTLVHRARATLTTRA